MDKPINYDNWPDNYKDIWYALLKIPDIGFFANELIKYIDKKRRASSISYDLGFFVDLGYLKRFQNHAYFYLMEDKLKKYRSVLYG